MRTIRPTARLLYFLDELDYTEAALSANPETADLADHFRECIAEWDAVFGKARQARRKVTRAEAVVAVSDVDLDDTTNRFAGTALVESGQDRKAPLFRRFFPKPPSEIIRTSLRKQCEYTKNVILVELGKLDAKSPLKPFQDLLQKEVDRTLGALDSRGAARGEQSIAKHDVDEWKEGVNRLRLSTYAELLKRSTANGRNKAWADSFFRAVGTNVTVGEAGEESVEPARDTSPDL